MADLSIQANLIPYLENGPFASEAVAPLSGGLGNYAFRLSLKQPHQGKRTAILKHGKAYIPGMESMAFDLERQVRQNPSIQ